MLVGAFLTSEGIVNKMKTLEIVLIAHIDGLKV